MCHAKVSRKPEGVDMFKDLFADGVHFRSARLPYHLEDLAAGGAAHDRVIHEHHPFPGKRRAIG